MAAWLTYFRERFPLASYLPLAGGISVSGALLGAGRVELYRVLISFIGILVFFAELRLMDERKDYHKDQVAHPQRPLPRGLLSVERVERVISLTALLMLLSSIPVAVVSGASAAVAFIGVTGFLWLMYREFFCGDWLETHPLLYAASHQIVLFPLCAFSVLAADSDTAGLYPAMRFGLAALGAFFAYEVCRKLDPTAHRILKTYLHVFGRTGVFAIVAVALLIAASGASLLGLRHILWPAEFIMLAGVSLIWFRPKAHRAVEALAGIHLFVHLWAIPLAHVVAML